MIRRAIALWAGASLLAACAPQPPLDIGAIQTATAKTVVAEITANAPVPATTPAPPMQTAPQTQSAPSALPPPGSPRFTPPFNPFANVSAQERECLIKEWGEKVFQEIANFTRPPSPAEEHAMSKCLNFQLPAGAQTPGARLGTPPPGAGQPPSGTQPSAFRDQTWFAISTDGLNWSGNTLLAEKASVPEVLRASTGVYWAFWVDFSAATGPNSEKIGIAKSNDGKVWEKLGTVRFSNLGTKVPVDPDVVELDDGRFRMYFYDITIQQGDHPIHSAVSSDGINFTVEEGTRFKAQNIFDPDVVRLKDGRWRMFLNNADKIISATSSEGLSFTADSGVRVETRGSIPGSILLPDGAVRLYTCGKGISAYKSMDGLNFTLEKDAVIRAERGVVCDPSVAATPSGFLMLYKVNPGQ